MKCSWCAAVVDAGQSACPRCGAAIAASNRAMRSGWAKLPGRKDMAKLQFGNSWCQIEGTYVPVADLKLAPEDWVVFAHHVMLWKDPQVSVTAVAQDGPWKMLAGPSGLLMEARGPGHIAFSQDSPGELITLPLEPGKHVHVRQHAQSLKQAQSNDPQKHLFLAATGNVTYSWFDPGVWFHSSEGSEIEHHYPVGKTMDSFGAKDRPGLLLLHAAGNVFVRELTPGQHILIKPPALVFKDSTVKMDLYYEVPSGGQQVNGQPSTTNPGYIWLRLHGPGRVAIQSVFEGVEGEEAFRPGNRHSFMYPFDPPAPVKPLPPPTFGPAKTLFKIGIFLAGIEVVGVGLFLHFVLGPELNMNNSNDHPAAFIFLLINGLIAGLFLVLSVLMYLAVRSNLASLRKQKRVPPLRS